MSKKDGGIVELEFSAVVIDPDIYPREAADSARIEEYKDALRGGSVFPPISIEEDTGILLDGLHRLKAHQQYSAEYAEHLKETTGTPEKDRDEWAKPKETILAMVSKVPEGVPRKLYTAFLNTTHGDKLKTRELKAIAREIYEANPDFSLETLKGYMNRSVATVHDFVKDILARNREQKRSVVYRLSLLGWTQEEIAAVVGLSHQNISQEILPVFSELKKLAKSQLASGFPASEVATRHGLTELLVQAIALEEKNDPDKITGMNIKLRPYDVWNFAQCDELYGADYPGRIPGELVAHTLYFYSKPGDVIVDPMAGSGTTLDVCLAMGRKCYGYDMENRFERPDIIKHDLASGWPERTKKASLIFWDAPYFSKKDGAKSGQKDGYIEGSISRMDRGEYLAFFEQRFQELQALVKKGTTLAFLMSDWDDDTGKMPGIFLWDYADLLRKTGWEIIRQIQCPLSTQQVHPDIINKFREQKRLARLGRYLLIAES